MPSVIYAEHDLKSLTKAELARLIQRQIEHWPYSTFNVSRTRRDVMVNELLNRKNGFTRPSEESTAVEHPSSPPSPSAMPHSTSQQCNSGPQSPTTPSTIVIHIFLQDRRFSPTRRHAADLELLTTAVSKDSQDCEHILAADLFSKLQSSYAQIQAPAIISTPHYLNPSYSHRFSEWTDGPLPDAIFEPSTLRLSSDHRLTIFLDKILSHESPIPAYDLDSENSALSHPTEASKLWLRAKLLEFPRYSQFRENQHRRQLQNFDILEDWNFAVQVYHQYYKTVCDATQRPITRLVIQGALEIGETLLTDALTGSILAARYGPGGPYESAEVVQELSVVRDSPQGKGALLKYLENWNTAHPCA